MKPDHQLYAEGFLFVFLIDLNFYIYPELLSSSVRLSSCSLVASGGTWALPVSAVLAMGLLYTLSVCPPHQRSGKEQR